jgi:hypothetical protein
MQTLLVRLSQDGHPSIRAEAQWRLQEARPDGALQATDPALGETSNESDPSFFKLELNVGNFLAFSGQRDYDRGLIERAAAYSHEHPITLGYDLEAYWRAFAARA